MADEYVEIEELLHLVRTHAIAAARFLTAPAKSKKPCLPAVYNTSPIQPAIQKVPAMYVACLNDTAASFRAAEIDPLVNRLLDTLYLRLTEENILPGATAAVIMEENRKTGRIEVTAAIPIGRETVSVTGLEIREYGYPFKAAWGKIERERQKNGKLKPCNPKERKRDIAKVKGLPLGAFLKQFSSEGARQEYLAAQRWKEGFVCPKCGSRHGYRLKNGRYQCVHCRHHVSVTAGTVLHKTHMPLTQWVLAFYLVCQDKRGISAVQLSAQLGTTYKTAWYMLKRIRAAMGQRDETHLLTGTIDFDDAYFGGPVVGKKRGRGTEKAKVFVALSLDCQGNPQYLKMRVTPNIRKSSVRKFARSAFAQDSVIRSDGYRSYIPALKDFTHEHKTYDPDSGLLHWLHIMVGNARAFILGTYHGLPKDNLQSLAQHVSFLP